MIKWTPVNSPHKGQWRGALMFSFICVWIDGWVNNREAGDLRRYRAHYDVIVMKDSKLNYFGAIQHAQWHSRTAYVRTRTLSPSFKRFPLSDIDGFMQDGSNSSALAMELVQSSAKPSICSFEHIHLTGLTLL